MKKIALCLLALSLTLVMVGSAFATDSVVPEDVLAALKTAEVGFFNVKSTSKLSADLGDYEYDDHDVLYIKEASMKKDNAVHDGLYMVALELTTSDDVVISLVSSDAKPYTYFSYNDVNVWEAHENNTDPTFYINSRDYSVLTTVGSFSGDIASVDESSWFKASVQVVEKLPSVVAKETFEEAIAIASDDLVFDSLTGGVEMLVSDDIADYLLSSVVLMEHARNGEIEAIFGVSMDKNSCDFTVSAREFSTEAKGKAAADEADSLICSLNLSDDKTISMVFAIYSDDVVADFNIMLSSADILKLDKGDSIKFGVTAPLNSAIYLGEKKLNTEYSNGVRSFLATLKNSPDEGVMFSDLYLGADFTVKETTAPSSDSSNGCNAVGFVPAALLLVAPLFFLRK